MLNCLRYFRILPPIDEEKEKTQLFDHLKESVQRADQVVKDLKFDFTLCSAHVKQQTEKWKRTKDPTVCEELKQMMTEKKQISISLSEAQQRLGEYKRVYRQTKMNVVNVDDAKQVAKINKQLKKLDVNIDHLADDTRVMGDLLSDQQRAADSTRPYSGGLAIASLGDDEFQSMLAEECKQLELEALQTCLRTEPRIPTRRHAVVSEEEFINNDGGGGGDGSTEDPTVERDIRNFLIQCDDDAEDDELSTVQISTDG